MNAVPLNEHDDNVLPFAKPTISFVAVTPELAARWLIGNKVNRNLRETKVNQYAADMRAGRWTEDASAICFDPEGHLLNGQHRLHAVIQTGCTITFAVMRNVRFVAMRNMDNGGVRSPADMLKLQGYPNAHLLASVARSVILVEDERIYQDNKAQGVSRAELDDWVAEHPAIHDSVHAASSVAKDVATPPTALGVTHWMIARVAGQDLADLYLRQLARPANEPEGSAVFAVQSRLSEIRRNRQVLPVRNHVYLLLKGWSYYAAGKPVQKLQAQPKKGAEFRLPEVARWTRRPDGAGS